jgi:putative hydrolase of the HAD superfamily
MGPEKNDGVIFLLDCKSTYLYFNFPNPMSIFMKKHVFSPTNYPKIKNIIFDLGGVIFNINYQYTIEAFVNLGIRNFEQLYTQAQQIGIFDALDRGTITPAAFRDGIRSITSIKLTDQQIDDAWNAMLIDLPENRLALLKQIKNRYRTFLLSNTNSIHIDAFHRIIIANNGLYDLNDYFEQIYFSHLIHLRKPDPEVFELIIRSNGLKPSETLFIDDSLQHVEGAKRVGLNGYHLDIEKGERLESLFAL